MATIVEENQPDELDEEDLQEKAWLGSMLLRNYERDLSELQSETGGRSARANSCRHSMDQAHQMLTSENNAT